MLNYSPEKYFLVMTNEFFLNNKNRSSLERSSNGKSISSYANPFSMILLIYATFSGIYWLTLVNRSAGRTWEIIRKTSVNKKSTENNNKKRKTAFTSNIFNTKTG